MLLDKNMCAIDKQIRLESVPVFIAATGSIELDYKIFVACRNGFTYLIKNWKISSSFDVHIESKPVGMIKLEKTLVIAGMNRNVYSFYNKGKINFTKKMPADITDIQKMQVQSGKLMQLILISLKNGEVRIFNDKYHVHTLTIGEPISAMKFGIYGREEGCLVVNTFSGALHVKIL